MVGEREQFLFSSSSHSLEELQPWQPMPPAKNCHRVKPPSHTFMHTLPLSFSLSLSLDVFTKLPCTIISSAESLLCLTET